MGATLYMTGLIWFVQVVHYPLFDGVCAERFSSYEARHQARTSLVVIPPMLLELGTAAYMVMAPPAAVGEAMAVALLLLVLLCWASTFLLQVPMHERLSGGFDSAAHRRLVSTNWVRTLAWSARAVLLLWLAASGA
jgi:hypothetical protein